MKCHDGVSCFDKRVKALVSLKADHHSNFKDM